jgi:hypothetical protein
MKLVDLGPGSRTIQASLRAVPVQSAVSSSGEITRTFLAPISSISGADKSRLPGPVSLPGLKVQCETDP